jgi:hypothetical protein
MHAFALSSLNGEAALTNEAEQLTDPNADLRVSLGCRDDELEALAAVLTDAKLFELLRILERIRSAPGHLRSVLATAIPIVLMADEPPPDRGARALAAAKAIIQRFP